MGAREIAGRVAYEARDIARGAIEQTRQNIYVEGYQKAADISIGVLDEQIAVLMDRMTSDNPLTGQEQFLLGSLNKLREEMAQALDGFWEQDDPTSALADERPQLPR
ncbi:MULTISPECIES: hypothetical protein [Kitasatospora]|uniref:Uncharacterized protein n=1 Tax=Kitasatospora setae (strain ATCC 33774 / DSM 43861 / JCM 3304 / KCC A-0304 / NBRC 14216 / KM-6054) TaxID=452652 RepID=E4NHN6_KITSK|nr:MULTISPECIES: hypothetical protein [Kitasatospora]BAJ31016.1 hypothetical protein KSE_52420 [Kitasatospora setae KM-6054]